MPLLLPTVEIQNVYSLYNAARDSVTANSPALRFTVILSQLSLFWSKLNDFLKQPIVFWPLIAFSISLIVIYMLLSCLGFAPQGVLAGSLAALFQGWMYGGFTPASGIFATLTSIGMLGVAQPVFATMAIVPSFAIAGVVAVCVR